MLALEDFMSVAFIESFDIYHHEERDQAAKVGPFWTMGTTSKLTIVHFSRSSWPRAAAAPRHAPRAPPEPSGSAPAAQPAANATATRDRSQRRAGDRD